MEHLNQKQPVAIPLFVMLNCALVFAPQTSAQSASSPAYEDELRRQGALIEQLQKEIDALKKQHHSDEPPPNKQAFTATRSSAANPQPQAPVGQKPPEPEADVRALPESNSRNGVLVGDGQWAMETSLSYSYNDNNRVFLDGYSFIPALIVGLIDIREVKRHSAIASLSLKYGLTERWEIEVKTPYVARNDTQRSRPVSVSVSEDEIFDASGEGLGDIQVATRYQLNEAGNGIIYVANLQASFPTGTSPFDVEFIESTPGAVFPTELPTGAGYMSIQPSLSAIYPTDPGVFFGNVSYSYNEKIEDEEIGEVDAGDGIGVSFGLGLSLNARTSMSVSYAHKHVLESKINDVKIDGSELDIGQLIIGYSFRYSPSTNINVSMAVGVTDDAQDIRLNLRVPITF
ncbi:transporter [Salinimonas chungwhensis]|uniref:transporter n=1 Tax=Salinimonas chungwhensis TaxID=265425 RepID=UPI00036BCE2B|nr:transporter [Salinimonas chungwhensis]